MPKRRPAPALTAAAWGFLLAITTTPAGAALRGPASTRPPAPAVVVERERVVEITASPHHYTIEMGGTVDGAMTEVPGGWRPPHQGWQPNVLLRIENLGDHAVETPWLRIDGRGPVPDLATAVRDATAGLELPADRARAIWEFLRERRFHATTWDRETADALKAINVYGYTLCAQDSRVLSDLWGAAGFRTRRYPAAGHALAEVEYDGGFHLFDGDTGSLFLARDGVTVASGPDLARDPALVARAHTYGITEPSDPGRDARFACRIRSADPGELAWHSATTHTMAYRLRPGESIEWRWDHRGKQYSGGDQADPSPRDGAGDLRSRWGDEAYARLSNGLLRYRPDLPSGAARTDLRLSPAMVTTAAGLHPAAVGVEAVAVVEVASPYVLVGGSLHLGWSGSPDDLLTVERSRDGANWRQLYRRHGSGDSVTEIPLDAELSRRGAPDYRYFLRVRLLARSTPGSLVLRDLAVESDFQHAYRVAPDLRLGTNGVDYRDGSRERRVRVSHEWLETSAWRPPGPAPGAVAPRDGSDVAGTDVVLRWQPAIDPDGLAIADYHVQLSDRADLRWPLTPTFDRLLSRTVWQGQTAWTARAHPLAPGRWYYWRVRALDADGVWGPWSRSFRFRTTGPEAPGDVTIAADPERSRAVLSWQPAPSGPRPTRYRVYGSDRSGFTASDGRHPVYIGRGDCDTPALCVEIPERAMVDEPGNFLAETTATEMLVIGSDLDSPAANRAHYRVVAVDAAGSRSVPSAAATIPRPFLHRRPPLTARVGVPYRHVVASVRSEGSLACPGDGVVAAWFESERMRVTLVDGPPWLQLDAETDAISGVPTRADVGAAAVELRVALEVGGEQTTTTTERFAIEVVP